MRAITVRQPWAWAIARGGKDIENRSWGTSYRGLLAIHAGVRWDEEGAFDKRVIAALAADKTADGAYDPPLAVTLNAERSRIVETRKKDERYTFGAIIAVVDLGGIHNCLRCARRNPLSAGTHPDGPYQCSRWAVGGSFHWELSNVRPLAEPVPCKGRLSLWDLPDDVEAAVLSQIREAA